MQVNILEIAVAAIILLFAVTGYRRGFVKKLAAMVSLLVSVALVSALLPWITDFLKENTPVYTMIEEQCRSVMEKQIGDTLLLDAKKSSDDSSQAGNSTPLLGNLTRIEQTELIENLPLPEFLQDLLLDYNNEEGYKGLGVGTFQDYLTGFIATGILNVAAFLISVLVVHLLLWLSISALSILTKLPVIRVVNRVAGLVLGLLQALLVIWLACLILSLVSGTEPGMQLMELIKSSSWLNWLYESNLFLEIVLRASVFFG